MMHYSSLIGSKKSAIENNWDANGKLFPGILEVLVSIASSGKSEIIMP